MELPEIIPPSATHEPRRRTEQHGRISIGTLSLIYFFAACALFVGIHLRQTLKESE